MNGNTLECVCCAGRALGSVELTREFEHLACADCGYENFRPIGWDIARGVYEQDPDYSDELALSKNFRDLIQWPHSQTLALILDRKLPRGLRSLDVGCFSGFFVKAMLELGYDAHGLDFNQGAVDFGLREYSLHGRLRSAKVEDLAVRSESYDIVTCFEVIEHVQNPGALLNSLASVLKPGGLLMVSTPNSHMCWRPQLDYPPHHLSRFTPRSLDLLLRRFGLVVLMHQEQMSLFDLTRHFTGAMFRSRTRKSLRGGELRGKPFANAARRTLNRLRPVLTSAVVPLDRFLHWSGLRYISQLAVAEKRLLAHNRQAPFETRPAV